MEKQSKSLIQYAIMLACIIVMIDCSTLIARGVTAIINGNTTLGVWEFVIAAIILIIACVVLVYSLKVKNSFYQSEKGRNLYTIFATTVLVVTILFMAMGLAVLTEAIKKVWVVVIVLSALEVIATLINLTLSIILFIKKKDVVTVDEEEK